MALGTQWPWCPPQLASEIKSPKHLAELAIWTAYSRWTQLFRSALGPLEGL